MTSFSPKLCSANDFRYPFCSYHLESIVGWLPCFLRLAFLSICFALKNITCLSDVRLEFFLMTNPGIEVSRNLFVGRPVVWCLGDEPCRVTSPFGALFGPPTALPRLDEICVPLQVSCPRNSRPCISSWCPASQPCLRTNLSSRFSLRGQSHRISFVFTSNTYSVLGPSRPCSPRPHLGTLLSLSLSILKLFRIACTCAFSLIASLIFQRMLSSFCPPPFCGQGMISPLLML